MSKKISYLERLIFSIIINPYYPWESQNEDRPDISIGFRNGKTVVIFFPKNHRKVEQMVNLQKLLKEIHDDRALFKVLFAGNVDAYKLISDSGKRVLWDISSPLIQQLYNEGCLDPNKLADGDDREHSYPKMLEWMAGKNLLDNKVLVEGIRNVRRRLLKTYKPDLIITTLERLKSQLPKRLQTATKPLEILIPLRELEKFAKQFAK
jgi:hypothetical protein